MRLWMRGMHWSKLTYETWGSCLIVRGRDPAEEPCRVPCRDVTGGDRSFVCDLRDGWYGHVSCFVIDFIHVVLRSSRVEEQTWELRPCSNQSSLPRSQETVSPLPYQAPKLYSHPSTSDRKNRLCPPSVSTDDAAGRLFRRNTVITLGARVPGFQWEHAGYIAGIETLCPAFAQQGHPVHIWNVIRLCVPNVPTGNISFTAGMRPCHVSEMYPPRTSQVLSLHVRKMFSAHAQVCTLQIHQFI
jgi:hypothetical protein